jgi:hypothetical protein
MQLHLRLYRNNYGTLQANKALVTFVCCFMEYTVCSLLHVGTTDLIFCFTFVLVDFLSLPTFPSIPDFCDTSVNPSNYYQHDFMASMARTFSFSSTIVLCLFVLYMFFLPVSALFAFLSSLHTVCISSIVT